MDSTTKVAREVNRTMGWLREGAMRAVAGQWARAAHETLAHILRLQAARAMARDLGRPATVERLDERIWGAGASLALQISEAADYRAVHAGTRRR